MCFPQKLMARRHRRWQPPRGSVFLIVPWVVLSVVASVRGQEYRSDTPDPAAAKNRGAALQCIRNPASFPENRAKFEEYFNKYYFPSMTGTDPGQLAALGAARYNLFKDFLWRTDNEALQRSLTDAAYAAMGRIVSAQNPPYHPAARYNAILVIGLLDEQYAHEGANPRPPKPYAKATTALTKLVDSATTSEQFPPPVILGAVIGLERHAQLRSSLAPGAVDAMTAALLKLVRREDPIQDMDRTAFTWLRLRAAAALAQTGSVGPNSAVHEALVKLIGDLKSLDDRCAAAALLKGIKYEGAKIDGATAAEALFALARDVGNDGAKEAKEIHEKISRVGGFTPGGGGMYQADGVTPAEQFPRRRVLTRLVDLRTGLQAVKPTVPAESQKKIDAVTAATQPVVQAASDKSTAELKLTQAVLTMAAAINQAVSPPQPPAGETAGANSPSPAPRR